MRAHALLSLLSVAAGVQGIRILQSNDDGWAELNARTFYNALTARGHNVVLSAPAENKSGSGSNDAEPEPRSAACQYNSCAANSGPVGTNATNSRLNWVNSFPVTSVKYGFDTFGPQIWNGAAPELVVTGVNTGSNVWLQVPFSGTVGAAVEAAKNHKVPAIAFSGVTGGEYAYNTAQVPLHSPLYAELATKLVDAVVAGGKPYLPEGVFLNVNLGAATGACTKASAFKYVLTRINPSIFVSDDALHCGSNRLPTETEVALDSGCYVSVSIGDANDKTTAVAAKQVDVIKKLGSFVTCY